MASGEMAASPTGQTSPATGIAGSRSSSEIRYMTANTNRELTDLEWLIQKIAIVRATWKVLLVSFLTLSILGCVVLFFVVRPVYSSQMVLPLTLNLQALIYTDAILGPVVRKIHPARGLDLSLEVERLASKIDVSELKKGSG